MGIGVWLIIPAHWRLWVRRYKQRIALGNFNPNSETRKKTKIRRAKRAAAHVCPKLCDAEMEVFRAILGEGVTIERAEHMMAGARRCVYRIRTGKP